MRDITWFAIAALLVACGGDAGTGREVSPHAESDAAADSVDEVLGDTGSEVHADSLGDVLAPDSGDDGLDEGLSPWPVDGGADFEAFFRTDTVQRVTLRVTQSEWDALVAHMLEYAAIDGNMRTNRYFRADFVHEGADGSTLIEEVGFRTRGNTTRVVPEEDGAFQRAHFKVKFDALFELAPGSPAYLERDARRFAGIKELSLKWGREADPSQIRELFAYELFRQVGVFVPRVVPIDLTFQIGERTIHYGLHLGIEQVDKPFLRKRFGGDNDGDLYKCLWLDEGPATLTPITNPRAVGVKDWTRNHRPAYDLQTNEETSSHEDLRALIDALATLDDAALVTWLGGFDVERFLRALAVNVLVGMPDDYWAMGNNYYLYFGERLTRFIPWDYDHGLGGGWGGEPAWDHDQIATSDPFVWKNLNRAFGFDLGHPLVDRLLAIPSLRGRYGELLELILDSGHFSQGAWRALYERQAPLYAPFLANDTGQDELMEPAGEEAWMTRRIAAVRATLAREATRP